jgi:predicted dehydrogenase
VKKLKAAILGTGFMGRVHTEGLRRLRDVEVIAARMAEAARKFADTINIDRATANYRNLLADPDLDAVHICTPNELHFPMRKLPCRQASTYCARSLWRPRLRKPRL